MRAYRIVWLVLCAALAMVGASVAFVVSSAALAVVFPAFAVVGSILAHAVVSEYGARRASNRTRLLATGALVGGTTAGAFVGFAVILGAGVFLLGLLVLVSSPHAVGAYGRWLGSAPKPSADQLDALARAFAYASPEYVPIQPLSGPRLLTDEQLCQGWRASYPALQERSSAIEMMRAVEERRRFLDEFERRNASGLAAWLASGARAAGNPLPYLTEHHPPHPAINWDELIREQDW